MDIYIYIISQPNYSADFEASLDRDEGYGKKERSLPVLRWRAVFEPKPTSIIEQQSTIRWAPAPKIHRERAGTNK